MRIICITTLFLVVYFYNPITCQQAVDPAYLRQYYAQLQAQQQQRGGESTPIHESQDQAPAQQYQPQVSVVCPTKYLRSGCPNQKNEQKFVFRTISELLRVE